MKKALDWEVEIEEWERILELKMEVGKDGKDGKDV